MKSLKNFILERFVNFKEDKFYLGQMFYNIDKDNWENDWGDDESDIQDTESNNINDILKLIDEWTKYPDNSSYKDAHDDGVIPVFYVFTGDNEDEELEVLSGDKFYISKEDSQYKDKIKKLIQKTDFNYLTFTSFDIEEK